MTLKLYDSVAGKLKQKVRKFWVLVPTFGKVTDGKLVETGCFFPIKMKVALH